MVYWKGIRAIIGAVLVHIILGTYYTFGNMNTYMTSYVHNRIDPDISYDHSIWINAFTVLGQGILSPIGGVLEQRIGARLTCFIGSVLFSGSVALTSLSINQGFILTTLTYGFLPGLGMGIAYIAAIANGMKWFPGHRGLVNGFVVSGFGAGALVFDLVQTAYLNPENIKPAEDGYFDDPRVLQRVPSVFLLLGGLYFALQFTGCCLLSEPSPSEMDETASILKKDLSNGSSSGYETEFNSTMSCDEGISLSPKEAFKKKEFYILVAIHSLNGQATVFINTMYKAFGQTFIFNDHFLTMVGSIASIFNCTGRLFWGYIQDHASFKTCMMVLSCVLTALVFSLYATKIGPQAIYAVWVFGMFFTFSGLFVLMPTATAEAFGMEYAGTNYGFITMGQCLVSTLTAFFIERVQSSLGWFGSCFLIGIFSTVAAVVTCFLPEDLRLTRTQPTL